MLVAFDFNLKTGAVRIMQSLGHGRAGRWYVTSTGIGLWQAAAIRSRFILNQSLSGFDGSGRIINE